MSRHPRPSDGRPRHRQGAAPNQLAAGARRIGIVTPKTARDIGILNVVEHPRTHAELTIFLRDQGVTLDWFIDMLQLTTLNTPNHSH